MVPVSWRHIGRAGIERNPAGFARRIVFHIVFRLFSLSLRLFISSSSAFLHLSGRRPNTSTDLPSESTATNVRYALLVNSCLPVKNLRRKHRRASIEVLPPMSPCPEYHCPACTGCLKSTLSMEGRLPVAVPLGAITPATSIKCMSLPPSRRREGWYRCTPVLSFLPWIHAFSFS